MNNNNHKPNLNLTVQKQSHYANDLAGFDVS